MNDTILSGSVWDDLNNNGIWDQGEFLLDGITIQLINFEGTVIATTTTDNGLYSFENLAPGPYVVKTPLEKDFQQSYPGANTIFNRGQVTGPWDYDDTNGDPVGPSDWGQVAPDADGFFQSPIDLTTATVDLSDVISFNYGNDDTTELVDKGSNVEIEYLEGNGNTVTFLGETFELLQFHFHYHSEHEVNSQLDDMEVHLVHRHEDGGLTVVGFLLTESPTDTPNEVLAPFFESVQTFVPTSTSAIDAPIELETPIELEQLIPENTQGWYYQGSLTTPPASEGVNWFVFAQPLEISSEQITIFQDYLTSTDRETNNRPVLPLNGRQINEFDHEVTVNDGENASNIDFGIHVDPSNRFGGSDRDELFSSDPQNNFTGNKTLTFTGAGNDLVDTSSSTIGYNRIYGGSGDDEIFAGKGDRLFGGDGNDTLDTSEGRGDNLIFGGHGDDTFTLGAGDRLWGSDGNDKFYVTNGGDNIITGGEGADQFWLVDGEIPNQSNRITDFNQGEDTLNIGGNLGTELDNFDDLQILSQSGLTTISVTITVNNVQEEKQLAVLNGDFTLTSDDFLFV